MIQFTTNHGTFTVELFEQDAPKTVANFLEYVQSGFYNGTIFHRVINGFMIQGGGFNEKMQQLPTRAPIENEAANGLKNERGTLAMARTNDPHSATAQFFINVVDNDFLNFKAPQGASWGYCVFGKVQEGMEVIDSIKKVATGNSGFHQNVPIDPVIIQKVEILSK